MTKTRQERIGGIDDEIARLRKRQALLRQQQSKQERKERTHRLCKRGGIVEKLLPDMARLTDGQFEVFVEKVLLTPQAAKVLSGLAPPLPELASGADCDADKATGDGTSDVDAAASADNRSNVGDVDLHT